MCEDHYDKLLKFIDKFIAFFLSIYNVYACYGVNRQSEEVFLAYYARETTIFLRKNVRV